MKILFFWAKFYKEKKMVFIEKSHPEFWTSSWKLLSSTSVDRQKSQKIAILSTKLTFVRHLKTVTTYLKVLLKYCLPILNEPLPICFSQSIRIIYFLALGELIVRENQFFVGSQSYLFKTFTQGQWSLRDGGGARLPSPLVLGNIPSFSSNFPP